MKFDKSTYVEVVLFQCRKILKFTIFFCDFGKKIAFE